MRRVIRLQARVALGCPLCPARSLILLCACKGLRLPQSDLAATYLCIARFVCQEASATIGLSRDPGQNGRPAASGSRALRHSMMRQTCHCHNHAHHHGADTSPPARRNIASFVPVPTATYKCQVEGHPPAPTTAILVCSCSASLSLPNPAATTAAASIASPPIRQQARYARAVLKVLAAPASAPPGATPAGNASQAPDVPQPHLTLSGAAAEAQPDTGHVGPRSWKPPPSQAHAEKVPQTMEEVAGQTVKNSEGEPEESRRRHRRHRRGHRGRRQAGGREPSASRKLGRHRRRRRPGTA